MNRTQKLGNVLIISSRKRMLSEFQSYLHSVLGEYLTFNTLLREQATDPSLFRGYQCVLFPTARAMETFPLTLDSSILQLPCDRVFNHMFLDKIIQIPPHERVYLVNDDKYSTLAIISQLEECGVTQYDFVPFYPGCKDTESDIQFAITAGEPAGIGPDLLALLAARPTPPAGARWGRARCAGSALRCTPPSCGAASRHTMRPAPLRSSSPTRVLSPACGLPAPAWTTGPNSSPRRQSPAPC